MIFDVEIFLTGTTFMKKVFAILGALLLSTGLSVAMDGAEEPLPVPSARASSAPPLSVPVADEKKDADWDLFGEARPAEAMAASAAPSSEGPLAKMLAALSEHDKRADAELSAMEARGKALHEVKDKVNGARGVLASASASLEKASGFTDLLEALAGKLRGSPADTYAWLVDQEVGDHTPFAEVSDNVPAGLVRHDNLAILPGDDVSRASGVIDLKMINDGDEETMWILSGGAGKGAFTHKARVASGSRVIRFVTADKLSGDGTVILISSTGGTRGGISDLTQVGTVPRQINLSGTKTDEKIDVSTGDGPRATVSVSCAPAAALWMMKGLVGKSGQEATLAALGEFVGRQVETDLEQVTASHNSLREFIQAKMGEVEDMMHALDAPSSPKVSEEPSAEPVSEDEL